MSSFRIIVAIVRRDLLTEWRTKEIISASATFALVVLLVFNFAFDEVARDIRAIGAGVLWTAFLFAAILAMNRLMLSEQEYGGLEGLMLAPLERTSLYLAKTISLTVLLGVTEMITLAFFLVLYNIPLTSQLFLLVPVCFLGTCGLAAVGTSFATIAVRTRTRELMLPLLLIPISVPLLLAALEATTAILAGNGLAGERNWLELLVAFDLIYLALGTVTFPSILEE